MAPPYTPAVCSAQRPGWLGRTLGQRRRMTFAIAYPAIDRPRADRPVRHPLVRLAYLADLSGGGTPAAWQGPPRGNRRLSGGSASYWRRGLVLFSRIFLDHPLAALDVARGCRSTAASSASSLQALFCGPVGGCERLPLPICVLCRADRPVPRPACHFVMGNWWDDRACSGRWCSPAGALGAASGQSSGGWRLCLFVICLWACRMDTQPTWAADRRLPMVTASSVRSPSSSETDATSDLSWGVMGQCVRPWC